MVSYTLTKLGRVYQRGTRVLDVAKKLEIIYTLVKLNFNISATAANTKFSRKSIYTVIKDAHNNSIFTLRNLGRPIHLTAKNNIVVHRFIERALQNNPALYLKEIKTLLWVNFQITLDESYISRIITDVLLFKRKKISQLAVRRSHPRIKYWRQIFRNVINTYDIRRLVFIDESHFSYKNLCRQFGRVQQGTVCEMQQQYVSKQSYSLLAAMNNQRIVHYEIHDTSDKGINSETYYKFFKRVVERSAKCSIFVQDNATIHFGDKLSQFVSANNTTIIQTSAYSADFNPIELLFAYIKAKLKKYNYISCDIMQTISYVIDKIASFKLHNYVKHCKGKWMDKTLE